MDLKEKHEKLKEELKEIHSLIRGWAMDLGVPEDQISLEIDVWGHWDAAYPHYFLKTFSKGHEYPLFDTYSLEDMKEEVDKLAEAVREKRDYCVCKKPEELKF